MKRQELFRWVMITLVVLALVVPASVSAEAVKTPVTGSETFVGVLDWGDWWESGGMVHVRGMVYLYEDVSSDPRLTGMRTVTINGNWGANGGPWWGTNRLETAYGVWEGTGNGWYYPDGSVSIRGESHGISGEVEGLLCFSKTEPGGPGLGTVYILDPHGE
jgi:hypothetical protein